MEERCEFPDIVCWFRHDYKEKEKVQAQVIKCGLCVKTFKTQSNLMYHRKECHENILKLCRKFGNGECSFGEQCWYKHTAIEDKKETIENSSEIIQRLFIMMENFAAKLEVLETRT